MTVAACNKNRTWNASVASPPISATVVAGSGATDWAERFEDARRFPGPASDGADNLDACGSCVVTLCAGTGDTDCSDSSNDGPICPAAGPFELSTDSAAMFCSTGWVWRIDRESSSSSSAAFAPEYCSASASAVVQTGGNLER